MTATATETTNVESPEDVFEQALDLLIEAEATIGQLAANYLGLLEADRTNITDLDEQAHRVVLKHARRLLAELDDFLWEPEGTTLEE